MRQSEQRYRTLFEGVGDGVMVYSRQGSFLDCNSITLERLGYSREEFLRLTAADVVHPDFHGLMKANQDRIRAGETTVVESAHKCKDGRVIPVEVNARMVEYEGQPAILAVVRDITDRKTLEDKLRASEERFRKLTESISDVFFAMDRNLRYTYWNKASEKLTGIQAEDAIGKCLTEVFPSVKGTKIEQFYMETLRTRQPQSLVTEHSIGNKDYTFEINAYPTKEGLSVFVKDITDRKKMEEEMRRQTHLLQNVFDSLTDALFVLDAKSPPTIVECNSAASTVFGYEKTEMIGKTTGFLHVSNDTLKEFQSLLYPAAEEGRLPFHLPEFHMKRKDGSIFASEHSVVQLLNDDGERIGWVSVVRDITEHKQEEEALRESEERYRTLVQMAPDAIVTLNSEGVITSRNTAASKLTGYSEDEIVGKHFSKLAALPAEDIPGFLRLFSSVLRGEIVSPTELVCHRKDGSIIWVEAHVSPIERDGKKIGIQAILRDVTERKKGEDEMKRRLMEFKLEDGNLYLVKESVPALSVEAFKDLLKVGYHGLVISRTPEEEWKKTLEGDFRVLWLAEKGGEKALSSEFDRVELLLKGAPRRSVVLLCRLDYLVSKKGFRETLSFVQNLRDHMYMTDRIVILSIDPKTLDRRELRLLEKETEEIEPRFIARLSEDLLEILRFVYKQNNLGLKPSYSDVRLELRISKPTAGKRIRRLIATGYMIDSVKGMSRILELTERGRNLFS